ncbi:MAG: glycerol-3-phosphate 1-O-acyltransferase PlsY [bacterium]|nr:glycerol-3-phosphate 1-O-acyltransferase PlsY [bacterium]
MLTDLGLVVFAYLLGSISFGLLLARLYGKHDLRQSGSGNIGAANVARTMGKTVGALTLLGDAIKGSIAVCLALWWGSSDLVAGCAALTAVLGHMFPLYHGLRGGKGVATTLGCFLPILPLPLMIGFVVWLATVAIWHYVSIGSILAAIALPLLAALLAYPPPFICSATLVALLVLYKHRSNIQRLREGTEAKLA